VGVCVLPQQIVSIFKAANFATGRILRPTVERSALIVPVGWKNTRFTRQLGTGQQQSTGGNCASQSIFRAATFGVVEIKFSRALAGRRPTIDTHTKLLRPFKTINKSRPARARALNYRPCVIAKLGRFASCVRAAQTMHPRVKI